MDIEAIRSLFLYVDNAGGPPYIAFFIVGCAAAFVGLIWWLVRDHSG